MNIAKFDGRSYKPKKSKDCKFCKGAQRLNKNPKLKCLYHQQKHENK